MKASLLKSALLGFSALFLASSIIFFPKASFDASLKGLTTWWEIVFPSLLPFFIISEIMIGYGVVKFIGVLMEPLMRPLFRVPGVGGFVLAMGVSSGFPAGAKLTARMRQEKQISAIEAERLVSFTNSSNPIFIFGAVAAVLFKNPALGILLAASHYMGNIIVGIFMRFHGRKEPITHEQNQFPSIKKAIYEMHKTRISDNRPFGKLLGDAVNSSVTTLMMIGGFMILFSVLNRIMAEINFTDLLASILTLILMFFQLSSELSIPFMAGLLEITLGSQLVSEESGVPLLHQAIIVSFILAFNGFSVQAQVASILSETDIRFKPFFYARVLHGIVASLLAFLLWQPLYASQQGIIDSFIPAFSPSEEPLLLNELWEYFTILGSLITFVTLLSFIFLTYQKLQSER